MECELINSSKLINYVVVHAYEDDNIRFLLCNVSFPKTKTKWCGFLVVFSFTDKSLNFAPLTNTGDDTPFQSFRKESIFFIFKRVGATLNFLV